MLNVFERNLKKGSVFSLGIKKWQGVCLACKSKFEKGDLSANMRRVMLMRSAIVWLYCPKCGQAHEIAGVTKLGGRK